MFKRYVRNFSMTAGEYANMECTLPATLYSVLMEHKCIDDPLKEKNLFAIRESIPSCCVFTAVTEITEAEASAKNVYLRISGVYARAEIEFNGRSYGTVENPDKVYTYDVADRVIAGENKIEIKCLGALPRRRAVDSYGNPITEYADAPDIADIGIVGECCIISASGAVINDLKIRQSHREGRAELEIEVDAYGDMTDTRAAATLVSPTGKIYFGNVSSEGKPISVSVPDPELWWPNGLGKPFLYKLSVTLYHGGEEGDTYERLVGLRDVKVEKNPSGAYTVTVNGVDIFSKGATYMKESAVLPHIERSKTEALIKTVVQAGMNTLRLFGDTSYVPEFFYELCDKNGILIWQNVSVSYISPNAASAFSGGITDAVKDKISIAAAHPSVALMYLSICASDEEELSGSEGAVEEFRTVCMRILEPVIASCGCGVPFFGDPEKLEACDERRAFADLYPPIPTIPSDETLSAIFGKEDINILTELSELHFGPYTDFSLMLSSLRKRYRFPYSMSELSYVLGLNAAKDILESVKLARTSNGRVTSAVLRQLNDSWPAISPSFIDFYGNKKAVSALASDFFAPLTVRVSAEGGVVSVYVSSDMRRPYTGRLTLALYDTSDKCIDEITRDVELGPVSSSLVISEDFSKKIAGRENSLYMRYELYDPRGINSHGTALFVNPSRFGYLPSIIDAEIENDGERTVLKMTSDTYASDVFIGFDGVRASVNENYISISPAHPFITEISVDPNTDLEVLREALLITTPYDIGR